MRPATSASAILAPGCYVRPPWDWPPIRAESNAGHHTQFPYVLTLAQNSL
jgi:hypothetical protein